MDVSFVAYRSASESSDCSAAEAIEDSEGSFDVAMKSRTLPHVIVADSDEDSDDSEDESFVISMPGRTRRAAANKILSDSEDDDDNDNDVGGERVLSAATRLSIFGVKRSDDGSSESDFIESDNEGQKSDSSPDVSVSDMAPNPHVELRIPSPLITANVDLTQLDMSVIDLDDRGGERNGDGACDMSIVDLSSDEDADVIMLSPKTPRSEPRRIVPPASVKREGIDKTYPNSGVKYVSEQTKRNELKKLEELRQDLSKIKTLLQTMNVVTLPDGGAKLGKRLVDLQAEIKRQQETVSNMVVEPSAPTVLQVKNDGFVAWDELKEGSDAVKPRMLGAQAMNTHMVQRALTLERLHALHSSMGTRPSEDTRADPPIGLVAELMPHQLQALAWLTWRETELPRGGILADDMGLGKTLTMISLVLSAKERDLDTDDDIENDEWCGKNGKLIHGGTLVVCPASLLNQWSEEIKKHCKKGVLKVIVHHGANRETKAHRLGSADVVVTTYNIIQRDFQKQGVSMRMRWRRVILDEAHVVRNHKSLTAQAAVALAARSRWCLTGTPVQNKDLDLFSLLKFLRCSPFDEIVVWKKWIDNKSTGGQERLTAVLKTLLLRRTKEQLQNDDSLMKLPAKTVRQIDVVLSREEMNVYKKVLLFSKTLFGQFLQQRSERRGDYHGAEGVGDNREAVERMHKLMLNVCGPKNTEIKSHQILVLLLRLRQICCHPGLVNSMLDDEQCGEDLDGSTAQSDGPDDMDLLGEISRLNLEEYEPQPERRTSSERGARNILHVSNPVFDLGRRSAKIQSVLDCLKENVLNVPDKAIVVSQWTSVLEIVKNNLKTLGVKLTTLSGKVPVPARQEIVRSFNDPKSGVKVLLLSLCAGGVGLNLVGGNHLLLIDLHWNPQLESQAQDRIYRFGQTKPVHIYKFVCTDTVESSIKKIQDKKLELAENMLTGAKNIHSSKLSIEDLKLMFNMT